MIDEGGLADAALVVEEGDGFHIGLDRMTARTFAGSANSNAADGIAVPCKGLLRADDAAAEAVHVAECRHGFGDHGIAVVGSCREVLWRCHAVQPARALDLDAVREPVQMYGCVRLVGPVHDGVQQQLANGDDREVRVVPFPEGGVGNGTGVPQGGNERVEFAQGR